MMGYTSHFLLLMTLSGVLSQTTPPTGNFFDCRRTGISCTDGTCDAGGTTCTCGTGFQQVLSYHCLADAVATSTCTDASICQNGGECRVDSGTDTCFCGQLYTGTNCELPRIQLDCGNNDMTVTARPHGTFGGAMYAKGQSGDTNCRLTASGSEYSASFALDPAAATNCGVTLSDLLDGGGTKVGSKYTVNIIIQYESSPDIVMGTDQELEATCSYPDTATATGVIFETDATGNLDAGTGDAEGSPIVFSILGTDGTTALTENQVVNVGDELTMSILLEDNAAFPQFLVDSCTAANSNDPSVADYATLTLVETGGCPANNKAVRGDHVSETPAGGKLVKIPLYAFMFVLRSTSNKNTLYFFCTVKLCDPDAVLAGTCDAPDTASCTGDFTAGLGKRRRRAADGDTRIVGQSLTVRFGNSTLEEELEASSDSGQTGVESDTSKCLKNPELQTVISVLALFLLILLIALIVITSLYCRRSRHAEGKYVDDGHNMGSSTQTLSMHIPRPRV